MKLFKWKLLLPSLEKKVILISKIRKDITEFQNKSLLCHAPENMLAILLPQYVPISLCVCETSVLGNPVFEVVLRNHFI